VALDERAPATVDDPAQQPNIVRRTVLGGLLGAAIGGGGYLMNAGVVPGRETVLDTLGFGRADGELPRLRPGPVHMGTFPAANRGGAATEWVLALPPHVELESLKGPYAASLPVCVLLHGVGDRARDLVSIGYDVFLAQVALTGTPPFAIAAVDGGDRWWHARRDGDDTGRMVVEEFLPTLARLGLRTGPYDKIALLGYSMGGYGALLLAEELRSARVAAVVAQSPALYTDVDDAMPGAFDDAADFRRHDVFARRGALSGIPVKIDCGLADPFYRTSKLFADTLDPPPISSTFGRGDHGYGYWRSVAASSLEFVGRALAAGGPVG
jgi:pimeloyl-ACP methyl ester carboxylesterase